MVNVGRVSLELGVGTDKKQSMHGRIKVERKIKENERVTFNRCEFLQKQIMYNSNYTKI